MADNVSVSGTTDPYTQQYYSAGSTEKNTLTVTSFIKLLAAQLANQMAMVQSMGAMTDSITTSTAVTSQTYAAGLVGQELTVAVTKEGPNGLPVPVDVKYGKVESVNLTGGVPMLKLEGDDEEYPLSYVLGIGRIDNPYAEDEDEEGGNEGGEGDKVTEKGKAENPLLDENLYV